MTCQHVVLKQAEQDPYHSPPNYWNNQKTVPTEAMIMAQANEENNHNILKLRAFQRFEEHVLVPIPEWRYRYYLEYCPHTRLPDLIEQYRHFGEMFPELFIWHMFHNLASAVLTFETTDWKAVSGRHEGLAKIQNVLVHLDMKADNGESHTTALYPVCSL